MLPKELQILIDALPPKTQVLFKAVVSFYEGKLAELEARIKELEDKDAKNSGNSSKPPSTDEFQKVPKSLRKKSTRKQGGQVGHKGDNLKMVEEPDDIVVHKVLVCSRCQSDLSRQPVFDIKKRQVYDIPPIEIKILEHQSEVKICNCGHCNDAFPSWVNHYVQYGPRIKSMIVYLQDYQLLPYERTQELIKDFFNHTLSTGTLYNIGQSAFKKLSTFKDRLKELLTYYKIVGFDETGFRVLARRQWLHSYSTNKHAYYEVHEKRGLQAMQDIGILQDFKGIAVHDFWKSYYSYNCTHAACNAHLLRDLIFIKERFEQPWAEKMIDLLLHLKALKEKAIVTGKSTFSKATLKKYRQQYNTIIQSGFLINPYKPPKEKSRGRYKKSPPRNLVERLRDYADDVLRFFQDFQVPFDNNFSERDIRMMKVKQKISGCFRSLNGAKFFARIRSYIVTARKQNVNPLQALTNLFMDNTIGYHLTSELDLFFAEQ